VAYFLLSLHAMLDPQTSSMKLFVTVEACSYRLDDVTSVRALKAQ